jgi:WD40 repeat protein
MPRGRDANVEVRDLRSDEPLYTRAVSSGFFVGPSFSGDGRALVASGCCSGASTVAGWDARSGAPLFRRTIAQGAITFAFLPDARALAVGTETGHLLVLDGRSGEQRGTATKVAGSGVAQIAMSPDGRLVAVSPMNGGVTVWDLRSRRRVGDEFPQPPDVIPQVAFEPDGQLLMTEAGRAIEWPLDRPTLQRRACEIAGRDLKRDEWANILPNRPYRPVCPAPGTRAQGDADG